MLISEGHFRNVLSEGYRPEPPENIEFNWKHSNSYSLFHTHGENSPGLVYDNCVARNGQSAFFDHHREANRPAAVFRDNLTENVRLVINHGDSTEKIYMVGHRHNSVKNDPYASMGYFSKGKNFVEDSIFTFDASGRGQWHPKACDHLRMRNSVIYVRYSDGQPRPVFLLEGRGGDWVYENVTLILDLRGQTPKPQIAYVQEQSANEAKPRWVFRDSVIAVINGEGVKRHADDHGVALGVDRFGRMDIVLDNTVLTYLEGVPEDAGVEGEDFFFVDQSDLFSGNPEDGDFTLRADGLAAELDVGYREGREPIFRPEANDVAEAMPFYREP